MTSKTDFLGVNTKQCPIQGSKQTWKSYKEDLLDWYNSCEVPPEKIGSHVKSRGFSENQESNEAARHLGRDGLKQKDGFDKLVKHMDTLRRVESTPQKLERVKNWLLNFRKDGVAEDAFVENWRKVIFAFF